MLPSCLCTQARLESPEFRGWRDRLGHPAKLHRKYWEHAYICQALDERGRLGPGRRGLGFGVGREPLAAFFAARGCRVVATDLEPEAADRAGWIEGKQHAADLDALNERGLCPPRAFARRVAYRHVDMNAIPDDLRGFDFCWSSCSFEHVGSLELGLAFLENMLDCLRPGGVAVHTTEYNVGSDDATLVDGPTVIFRRRDIEGVADRLRGLGCAIDLDLDPGDGPADHHVDAPPYSHDPHLKLRLDGFVSTSIGLIVRKPPRPGMVVRLAARLGLRRAG